MDGVIIRPAACQPCAISVHSVRATSSSQLRILVKDTTSPESGTSAIMFMKTHVLITGSIFEPGPDLPCERSLIQT